MSDWYGARTGTRAVARAWARSGLRATRGSTKVVIAVTLLALLLVAATPVALFVGVVMMLLGHVVGGLALFGGSILVAIAAVTIAGMSGMRHLRKLVAERSFRVVQLDRDHINWLS